MLRPSDQNILWEFLCLAAHEDSIAAVQNNPLLARYAQNWGREGDFGCAAYHNTGIPKRELVLGIC